MSLGYAQRLSARASNDLGGVLGAPEVFDAGPADACPNVARLVELLRAARRVVVHTGAGISTPCGIPDFRGPDGVWTRQAKGLPPPPGAVPFELAVPSFTHAALVALHASGKVTLVVSCNVDGLHLRSGLPRAGLAQLHGDVTVERCSACGQESRQRDFEVPSVGFRRTGRRCASCGGSLTDTALDWEDALPEGDLRAAEAACDAAELSLCLGTSLRIQPASKLPLRTLRCGGKVAVVNLQRTGLDRRCAAVCRRRCDDVMRVVLAALGVRVPRYVRTDSLRLRVAPAAAAAGTNGAGASFFVTVCSAQGDDAAPLPWLVGLDARPPPGGALAVAGPPLGRGAKRARRPEPAAPAAEPAAPCGDPAAAARADGDGFAPAPGRGPPWRLLCTLAPPTPAPTAAAGGGDGAAAAPAASPPPAPVLTLRLCLYGGPPAGRSAPTLSVPLSAAGGLVDTVESVVTRDQAVG